MSDSAGGTHSHLNAAWRETLVQMNEERPALTKSPDLPYPAKIYYRGEVAKEYNRERTRGRVAQRKWTREYSNLKAMMGRLPLGATILDVPCGTCRFGPVFEARGFSWVGADVSPDMLRSVPSGQLDSDAAIGCVVADAEFLPFRTAAVDYVVSMRFFNLIPHAVAASALRELARVACSGVIIEIRLGRESSFDPLLRQGLTALRVLRSSVRRLIRPTGKPRGHSQKGEGRYKESDFELMLRANGLQSRYRRQISPSRLGLQPDRLFLFELVPIP